MTQKALRFALEALDNLMYWDNGKPEYDEARDAITAIKEALANVATEDTSKERVDEMQKQRHEQEPVALPCCGYADASAVKWNPYNRVVQCHNCGQIYTTPPQRTWVGLTDWEINSVANNNNPLDGIRTFARAIEAKLKEKNSA